MRCPDAHCFRRLRGALPDRLCAGLAVALAAVAVFAGGCAGVPDAAVIRHARTQQAQFENAWGPVSARTSAAIVNELKRRAGGDLDILDRQLAIEQAVVGEPLVLGNKVTLLQDGPATYRARLEAVQAAKSSINVEAYIIRDDEVGQVFATALLERAAAGVKVNVIYDSVGSLLTPRAYFDRLRAGGIQVLEFNPINPAAARKRWSLNHRDHRKLFIVDGRIAILGGMNIDRVYDRNSSAGRRRPSGGGSSGGSGSGSGRSSGSGEAENGWRDTDIRIEGPAVADFQKLFLQTWEKQKGPPLRKDDYFPPLAPAGNEIVRAIGSTPDDPFSASYLAILAAITHAQREVFITNAYFVPDAQLVQALLDAAARQVDVRLVLPSKTDSRSAAYAAHSHYEKLLAGGVKIYERQGALLHAKTIVVDGVWSCVGSSNLDWRSAVDNDEVNAVVLGREFGRRMLEAYAYDMSHSEEITLEQWRDRPWRDRVKEWFFRLFSRLL